MKALFDFFMFVIVAPTIGVFMLGYAFTHMPDEPTPVSCVQATHGVVCGYDTR